MTNQTPIQDVTFAVEYLSAWPEVTSLDRNIEVDRTDVLTVPKELDRFYSRVIVPLSAIVTRRQLKGLNNV